MCRLLIPLPNREPDIVVVAPQTMTSEEWVYLTSVLEAMKPGLVATSSEPPESTEEGTS